MDLFPAIDLQEGRVSRLRKGSFQDSTLYDVDPVETALSFSRAGFRHLHVVDLDGARYGKTSQFPLIRELASTGLSVQFGGGLRNIEDIEKILAFGASRAMVGSLLFSSPEMARTLFSLFGNKVLPAVDIKNDRAAVKGWTSLTGLSTFGAIEVLLKTGFTEALITSIDRDGTLDGPDLPLYRAILEKYNGFSVLAAGGISSCGDLSDLNLLGCAGAVLGKSIYEGHIDPSAALELVRSC